MKTFVAIFGLLASVNALVIRRDDSCCFYVSASGAVNDTIGQLDDGQIREGGGLPPAQFCITDDTIVDANGRGCILTPETSQWQCDDGTPPDPGFTIGSDGTIAYNGNTTFWECQTGDNDEANIYQSPTDPTCGEVTLTADCCSSPPSPSCPANLDGPFEFPHLIIPIDSSNPTYAPGTSFFGQISSTLSSIFNFDIPQADDGETCSLIFLFPLQSQLVTSSYNFSGNGGLDFALLNGVADSNTSYSNAPGVGTDYGTTVVAPNNSYTLATFPCPAGEAISFEIGAVGDTVLTYFQDSDPSPIGLFITTC